ncbi:hypothetical protein PTTG_27078 [Puccinia triticina 1-1 BBBD Race 1]|uniref:MFS domain-containing protein n=2 Tax=Puccinia triticina TaxID=208348 RepID=A0A180GP54_PUCT1|nr:uncharacterized protein PtA15_8A164 [Puccinia triticina]OAV94238.1 hypothetical protein PTTG_27078 [Puccinia triticina 1-1 BBBD Race 1]WAQ87260.1 hypothetical protein PtA15_8A164 [Puccinia triticina]WAR57112.1 hypothetical protein PtB15_8B158 [Puccinia triticina]
MLHPSSLCHPSPVTVGRRWGVIVACAVFCVGVALQTASISVPVFAVGRVFAGLGVGMASCLVPRYQSECAPKWIRGAVVACYQWAITIGLLVAAVVVNATQNFSDASSYRIPINPNHRLDGWAGFGRLPESLGRKPFFAGNCLPHIGTNNNCLSSFCLIKTCTQKP